MSHASVFIAVSLDGFIARENGDIDWLSAVEEGGDEDYGFQAYMDGIDALVMGRATYETVRTFGAWPYGEKPVVVLSSQTVEIPDEIADTVRVMSGSPAVVVARLAERGLHRLYVDGGRTIQRFLEAGLIRRLTISTIPVLIGTGIPLFGPLRHDVRLRHVETHAFPTGLVQTTYEVVD